MWVERQGNPNASKPALKADVNIEKGILEQYGRVIEYSELKEKDVKNECKEGFQTKPMYFVLKSQLERFINTVIDVYSPIKVPNLIKKGWQTSEINLLQKKEDCLEVELCVEGTHFIPDKILRDDILFFFLIKTKNKEVLFVVVTDRDELSSDSDLKKSSESISPSLS